MENILLPYNLYTSIFIILLLLTIVQFGLITDDRLETFTFTQIYLNLAALRLAAATCRIQVILK